MKIRKSNIEIVKGYLSGTRPFTTIGYTPKLESHKDGDEWVDVSGKRWKMVKGAKISVNQQSEMIRTLSKQKCKCGQEIQYGSRLDEKFFLKTGKCFDCIIKEETELRVLGVFGFYEKYKMLSNYLGFLEDMKQKITDSLKYLEAEGDSLNILCNGEGFIEKFKGMNTTELVASAKKDLKEITETIATVSADKNKAKKTYVSELTKARKQWSPKKKQ